LSDTRPIQKDLKSVEALLPFLSNTALEYAIRKVQANQKSLKLNVQFTIWSVLLTLIGQTRICYKEQKR